MSRRLSYLRPNVCNFGNYMNDGVRKIDFVLMYKEEENNSNITSENIRRFYETNCEIEGLELETDRFEQKDEILVFVKLHVPWKCLCKHAEELHIKSPLWIHDKPIQKHQGKVNGVWKKVNGVWKKSKLNSTEFQTTNVKVFDKKTVINWPFKQKHMERYAVRDRQKFFTDKQRIEIAYEILQTIPNSPLNEGRRGIEILLKEKIYETAFVLHDGDIDKCETTIDGSLRRKLNSIWANWKTITRYQPLFDVRNYFGERIGFYYAFMDFYTKMLIWPSVVGILVFLTGIVKTATNPEIDEICIAKQRNESYIRTLASISSNQTSADAKHVSEFWMCPICKPPNCQPWEMLNEGCIYYTWAYRTDNWCSFVISAFTTMWAILFLKFWKRREACMAAKWDVNDVEDHQCVIRPEYEERAPLLRKSPVTCKDEPFVPYGKKTLWMTGSCLATVAFLVFACASLITLVVGRIGLYGVLRKFPDPIGKYNVDFARWLSHGLLFILVSVLEKVYSHLAHKLTIYECPKTEKEFMNSLLWKIFIFAMLNDIIPIGYAAWIKGQTVKTPASLGPVEELCDGGCMGEVTELVAVLLLMRLVVGNVTEIGIPMIKKFCKRFKLHGRVENKPVLPQYVNDFHLSEVELDGVYEDYMEMMVQYAFIVLFVPALPVAPFVCFLNNVAEIRVDAIKMIRTSRRALPIRVSGIGIWNKFLDILTRLGIIFNAALLSFTSDNVPKIYYEYIHNPGVGDVGFTKFLLSMIPVENFDSESRKTMTDRNITECCYPHFRESYYPFELCDYYWKIFSLRFTVFAAYCLVFYIFAWFVNTFVDDVPESVKTKIKRRHYLVTKCLETELFIQEAQKRRSEAGLFKAKIS